MQYFITPPLQVMDRLSRDMKYQLNLQSSKLANKNKIVEKKLELKLEQTQKENSQAEKLLEDQMQVGPASVPVQCGLGLLPTKPTETDTRVQTCPLACSLFSS